MNFISEPSVESLVGTCAAGVINAIADRWSSSKTAHVVITGGRTGLAMAKELDHGLFKLLRENSAFEGSMLHIWFSDERFLASRDPERNDSALISGFGLAKSQIVFHSVDFAGTLEAAAANYAEEIEVELGEREFDAVVLSMGEDGHIASLFPGQIDLDATQAVVAVHNSPKLPPLRVSLSLHRLAQALHIYIFAIGEGKAAALRSISTGPIGLLEKSSPNAQLQILTDLPVPATH